MADTGDNPPAYSDVKIPRELVQFLRHETYSLLIKGRTGTGKTTLALSILKELNINKNCLYISTRVSPEQLIQYHPWVENFAQTKRADGQAPGTGKINEIFVDARLDEPGSLFERITNELMDVKAPTIIIDTWDAIGSLMDRESLINNAKVLQTWRERARAKLVFVTEVPEDHTLDFLVDGIVELRHRHFNERLIREIFLSKLRGIRITKSLYTFSLNAGFFHSYEHYQPSVFFNLEYFFNPRHLDKTLLKDDRFSTGYHELDEILGGGFPRGGTVSLELGPQVNAKIAIALLGKIVLKFISNKNKVLVQPFEKASMPYLASLKDNMIIATTSVKKSIQNKAKYQRKPQDVETDIVRIRKRNQRTMLLTILSGESLMPMQAEDQIKTDLELFSRIRSSSDLTVIISRRAAENKHTFVSELADIRLNILEVDGTLFLQSESPWSHLYAISVEPDKEHGIHIDPLV
ncbi:MAG: hypothetical protein KGI33_07675 [Thaumarchaeota archaeon]|nr:hypothetical protein [Nitrososphaerota archaeon]